MSLLWLNVAIYIAGSVYMNGYSNQGIQWCVLFVKVEFHRINWYRYLQREIIVIQERITQIKDHRLVIYLIDQEDKGVSQSLIPTKMAVLGYLVIITIDLEIHRAALWWDLDYFQHCLLLILRGMISLDQIEQLLEEMQQADPIQATPKTQQNQICKDS